MLPSTFVFLESLPLTNGKVDRKALPRPDEKRPKLSRPYVPPRSEVEQGLLNIWEEVLGVRPVGIHDNFFDLGGHSLLATQVISRVMKTFKVELPIKSLFESPTVADMAKVITEHQGKMLSEKEMESLLSELESLSEEEAQKLLRENSSPLVKNE
jgi:acyl carrier protein